MLRQKKKKITPQILKQQEAEIKKKYKQKIKGLFSLFGHEQLFNLVPDRNLNLLFNIRFRKPHISCNGRLPHGFKTENKLNADFDLFMKTHCFLVPNTSIKICYYDYFTCGYDFCFGFLSPNEFKFNNAEVIKEELKEVYCALYSSDAMKQVLSQVSIALCTHYSSFNFGCYSLFIDAERKEHSKPTSGSFMRIVFFLKEINKPMPVEIKIGNNVRPAFEVVWIDQSNNRIPICLKASDLYLDEQKYPNPIPVYIQNHAIQRLNERISLIQQGINHFFVVVSLTAFLKVRQIEEKSYLLDFQFYDWKIGYLRADLIGGKLIIRTFLLSTQDGTPEAEKFKKITRLRKEDIEYLNMTSLGDLSDSGIENDLRLKAMFDEAGLTPLLECATEFYELDKGTRPLSERVNQYINLEPLMPSWHEVAETIADEMEPALLEQLLVEQE